MNASPKPWIRPQLIVLSRGTPEENVLAVCKTPGSGGPLSTPCNALNLDCSVSGKS